jgi:hypothetical protein
MNRINYVQSWSERHAGVALPAFSPALAAPLGAFASALALVAVMGAVQHARLGALEARGAEDVRRLNAVEVDLVRVRAVEGDVAKLRALRERVDAIRRSGPVRAGEIAAVGDRLPPDAWLTSLRAERAALALEGRGAGIDAVAIALADLARLRSVGAVRLLSLRGDPAGRGVDYALALDMRR